VTRAHELGDELLEGEVEKEETRLRGVAIRSTDASRNLDIFLACAIAGVLGNRFFLVLTGYPQLGNGTLHISHAIWGGLMMMTAIVAAVSFIAPAARTFVAFVGGAGFGWFVDELGKFITRDVNYFFRPTLALIYVVFVVMYLLFRALERRRLRPEEGILNALEAVKSAAVGRLDEADRQKALALLGRTCPEHVLRPRVEEILRDVKTIPPRRPPGVERFARRLLSAYERWSERRSFVVQVIAFFLLLGGFDVGLVLWVIVGGSGIRNFTDWATVVSAIATLTCVVIGAVLLPDDRLRAFRWFEVGVLIAIFVTQVFLFAERQLEGVLDLALALAVWVVLRSLIRFEGAKEQLASNR
jgi:hypothetical protein